MNKHHEITTIAELLATAKATDHLDNLLIDLSDWLRFALKVPEELTKENGLLQVKLDTFNWIDDGKHEKHLIVRPLPEEDAA